MESLGAQPPHEEEGGRGSHDVDTAARVTGDGRDYRIRDGQGEEEERERGDSEAARAKESLIVRIEFGQANGRGI